MLSRYGDQAGTGFDIGTDRLFAEDVYSCFSELGGQRDMGVVRSADNGRVWAVGTGEESSERGIEGGGVEGRGLAGRGAWVYNCNERSGRV